MDCNYRSFLRNFVTLQHILYGVNDIFNAFVLVVGTFAPDFWNK
jgi:hypothetical protein